MSRTLAAGPTLEVLTRAAELEALRPEWQRLWAASPTSTPFQSPAWLLAWWRAFHPGELRVFALRDNRGELAGLLPCYLAREAETGQRVVRLLGVGLSDYLDGIFPAKDDDGLSAAAFEHLRQRDDWDLCDWTDLPADSALLRAPVPPGLAYRRDFHAVCPALPIPDGAIDLRECLPQKQLRKLLYYRRRAERAGAVDVHAVLRAELDPALDQLFQMHGARWARNGRSGVLAERRVRQFHRDAAGGLAELGLLCLYRLHLAGRLAACFYGFCESPRPAGRVYYYISGFEPELRAFSPGLLIIGHAIEQALRTGAGACDFLRGVEPYKYAWGAVDQATFRLRLRRAGGREGSE